MGEYYKPYTSVSASAPQQVIVQSKLPEVLNQAGSIFQKAMDSVRTRELEDYKIAQEQERYKNALGFQQRAEERDIAKIAEERAKTLATNNALAVMENPNVVTSLNTSASDATSQNALSMYNQANADGVVTPQEQALLDSTYQKDLTRDVLTSGSADQKSLFDARQAVAKLKMEEDENKATADYRAKALAQQAQSSNLQARMYDDQRKAIDEQEKAYAVLVNSMKPTEKDVLNPDYVKVQDELNKATTNVSEFEKTNPNLVNASLTSDIVNQFIEARNQKSLPTAMNGRIDPYGQGLLSNGKVDSTKVVSVNQKLLEAVGGNKDIYDTLVKSNNAEKFLQYTKDKGDLPKLNQNILTTPEKVKQVSPASLEDIRQAILNDPKTNASTKLNILNNLTDDSSGTGLGGLINTTSKSGKSGSTGMGGLFGDGNDSNSLANKKYKENKVGEADAIKVKLMSIKKNNSDIPDSVLKEMNGIQTAQGMEQYIKNNFTDEFVLKDTLAGKEAILKKGIDSFVDKDDNDKNTGQNVAKFLSTNREQLNKLSLSQIEGLLADIKTNYRPQTTGAPTNWGSGSGTGDAIQNTITQWNENHKDIKLIKPSFGW